MGKTDTIHECWDYGSHLDVSGIIFL